MKHAIQNAHLEVKINTQGAEICSLRERSNAIEYIWQADKKHWARHAPILFPIVGKLKDDTYLYGEQTFNMTQHGFARDSEFSVVAKDDVSITFELTYSDETLSIYPARFVLQVTYELMERCLAVKYEVINSDNKTIYFSIGGHPAFNCPIVTGEKRSDYFLMFNKHETEKAYILKNGLLTNEQQGVIENDCKLPIFDNLFEQDALIFKDLKSDAVTLVDKSQKPVLSLEFPDTPYLGIWSKSQSAPFLCIEPWFGLADHVNSNNDFTKKEGIIEVASHARFKSEFSIIIH